MHSLSRPDLHRLFSSAGQDEQGQASFAFVLTILVTFSLFALGVDAGFWYVDHRIAQNQVEAAAMAPFLETDLYPGLPAGSDTAVQTVAKTWLTNNGVASPDTELAACNWVQNPRVFSSGGLGGPFDSVSVCIRRPSLILFSALANVAGVNVSAAATARAISQPLPYAMMAMNEPPCSGKGGTFEVKGSQTEVRIEGGGAYARSSCPGALRSTGGATLTATDGGINEVVDPGSATGGVWPWTTGDWRPDPYKDLTQPVPGPSCIPKEEVNDPIPLEPGTYCQQLKINALVTLTPGGVYIFRRGFEVSPFGGMAGDDILLYSTCPTSPCNGAVPGTLTFAPGSKLNLSGVPGTASACKATPPTGCRDMLFWVDRTAAGGPAIEINNPSLIDLRGRIYALNSKFEIIGDATPPMTLNMSIVAGEIDVSGGRVTIPYIRSFAPTETFISLVE